MSSFQIDPSKPYARAVNAYLCYRQYASPASIINEALSAYPGDPLVGTTIPFTTIKWEDATVLQQFIYGWFGEDGTVMSTETGLEITGTPGPNALWNASYTKLGLPGILTGGK